MEKVKIKHIVIELFNDYFEGKVFGLMRKKKTLWWHASDAIPVSRPGWLRAYVLMMSMMMSMIMSTTNMLI